MEKATARTVVNTGEYQAHPRRTPLNPRAAPATATATAAAITHGWAPGPSGRDAVAGDWTVGSSGADVPAPGPLLRCGARVIAGSSRRAARRRQPTCAGSAASKAAHASGQRGPGGYRDCPPPAQPQHFHDLEDLAGLVGVVRDQQCKGVGAERRRRGQGPGLGRGQVAQDRQDRPPQPVRGELVHQGVVEGARAVPATAETRPGGPGSGGGLPGECGAGSLLWPTRDGAAGPAECGDYRARFRCGWACCGPESWMAARLSAMDCSPAVPLYSSASGSGADGDCRKAGAPALSRNRRV